jgi:hypothetical protein
MIRKAENNELQVPSLMNNYETTSVSNPMM